MLTVGYVIKYEEIDLSNSKAKRTREQKGECYISMQATCPVLRIVNDQKISIYRESADATAAMVSLQIF